MTKRQRAQVVKLLRCAADNRMAGDPGLNGMFGDGIEQHGEIHDAAWSALTSSRGRYESLGDDGTDENYRHELLEAAQRVEEETWP